MLYALLLSILCGYLLGSINTSILISKAKGLDIRKSGSGNAGATNTLRVMGKTAAILVLVGDMLKTFVALYLSSFIAKYFGTDDEALISYCAYIAGLGAVLGHNFPVYFGFHGGKGIVSSLAVIIYLDYRIGIIIAIVSIVIMAITKYVSLGSVVGAILYPIFVVAFNTSFKEETVPYYIALSITVSLLALYQHRANIKRLLTGTESKLSKKK